MTFIRRVLIQPDPERTSAIREAGIQTVNDWRAAGGGRGSFWQRIIGDGEGARYFLVKPHPDLADFEAFSEALAQKPTALASTLFAVNLPVGVELWEIVGAPPTPPPPGRPGLLCRMAFYTPTLQAGPGNAMQVRALAEQFVAKRRAEGANFAMWRKVIGLNEISVHSFYPDIASFELAQATPNDARMAFESAVRPLVQEMRVELWRNLTPPV